MDKFQAIKNLHIDYRNQMNCFDNIPLIDDHTGKITHHRLNGHKLESRRPDVRVATILGEMAINTMDGVDFMSSMGDMEAKVKEIVEGEYQQSIKNGSIQRVGTVKAKNIGSDVYFGISTSQVDRNLALGLYLSDRTGNFIAPIDVFLPTLIDPQFRFSRYKEDKGYDINLSECVDMTYCSAIVPAVSTYYGSKSLSTIFPNCMPVLGIDKLKKLFGNYRLRDQIIDDYYQNAYTNFLKDVYGYSS